MSRSDNQNMIDALLLERAGYARRGLAERAAQVDRQLSRLGYTPPATPEPAPQTSAEPQASVEPQAPTAPPKARRTVRKDTA